MAKQIVRKTFEVLLYLGMIILIQIFFSEQAAFIYEGF